jgi:hypothetical protein
MAPRAIDRIRDAVVRSSQVAKLKLDAAFLRRERDRLVLLLGEATLALLDAGQVPERSELAAVLADVRAVDLRLADSLRQIDEIHRETGGPEPVPWVE